LLQDLNVTFRNIILPEALKIIQSQEVSVFSILSQLETMLADCGDRGLDGLIAQIDILHRNAVMGIKVNRNSGSGADRLSNGSCVFWGKLLSGNVCCILEQPKKHNFVVLFLLCIYLTCFVR